MTSLQNTKKGNTTTSFVPLLGALIFTFVLTSATWPPIVTGSEAPSGEVADTILLNGRIHTLAQDAASPAMAQAVAIRDGKIIFVGDDTAVQDYASPQTKIIDLRGKMAMPGFVDTHNHVFEGASSAGGECELSRKENLEGQIPYLEYCQDHAPAPGQWIAGYGHRLKQLLSRSNGRTPRALLDQYFPDNPIIIME